MSKNQELSKGFGTIRNNTALKLQIFWNVIPHSFGTIRNNTALKRSPEPPKRALGFGTIRNNTALKQLLSWVWW